MGLACRASSCHLLLSGGAKGGRENDYSMSGKHGLPKVADEQNVMQLPNFHVSAIQNVYNVAWKPWQKTAHFGMRNTILLSE